MNITQEEAVTEGLRDVNSTDLALDEGSSDWEGILQTALLVCLVVIGVLLSIIISGGTVAWAKGWFGEEQEEECGEEEEEENDDTQSSSHVSVDIEEADEDVVELASISDVSVHSEMRSLPRPEEEEGSQEYENDENEGWIEKNCYMS
ncbi:hypothetical protein PRIPAC_92875 [Pristionchus pacificus]|uniref:Uncharacterized protein n=1 Tax=Pristionchus pacificus TaxID=54126 RepID=A0A2A6CDK4_PRIPA|nr:hypothetical protein PRIPAC_92875 [Pristionchus pacificus]|eukprot:PDM76168.1 hypothetical protein PRIPAC_39772 [Pristionchus pacificus]